MTRRRTLSSSFMKLFSPSTVSSSCTTPSHMVQWPSKSSHRRVFSAMIMAVILSTTPYPTWFPLPKADMARKTTTTSIIFALAFSPSRNCHRKNIIGTATATTAASSISYRHGKNSRHFDCLQLSSFSSSSSKESEEEGEEGVSSSSSDTSSVPYPNPQTPEQTIQNQLYHFQRNDLRSAYAYASPSNKRITGPFSQFVEMVNTPPYDLILGCERFDVLLEVLPDGDYGTEGAGAAMEGVAAVEEEEEDDGRDGKPMKVKAKTSCCLVCIRPGRHARKRFPVWFWWEVAKVGNIDDDYDDEVEEEDHEDGDGDDFLLDDYDSRARWQSQKQQTYSIDENDSNNSSTENRGEWRVDCVVPDFEDLEFEAEVMSIEDFGMGDDDDDDDEDTIYLDFEF
ncbi:hypothetical protein ACHAXS_010242 [Conticribra weissflogii]